MLSEDQERSLTGEGDCFSHWHSSDRTPTHDFLEGLQGTAKVATQNTSYDVNLSVDYHLLNSASGAIIAQLPKARGNRLITFVRTSGANSITLTAASGETVNGAATLVMSSSYSPVRLLAVAGIGYIQV